MASAVKVLLIDDSSLIRRLLGRVLNQDPLIDVVGEAEDGKVGVELARSLQPQVIILDIEMPVMNGMEALPLLKKAAPRARIIMFSTLTESGARATLDALNAGADDYVTKPSNTGSFAATAAIHDGAKDAALGATRGGHQHIFSLKAVDLVGVSTIGAAWFAVANVLTLGLLVPRL